MATDECTSSVRHRKCYLGGFPILIAVYRDKAFTAENAESAEKRRLKAIYNPLVSVLDTQNMKIDQQPQALTAEFKI